MFCDAPEPPDTSRFAEANAALASRMADIQEKQYEWTREMGERGVEMAEEYYETVGKPLADLNFDAAVKDRAQYEQLYRPREAEFLAEVDKYLAPEYQEQLAAEAGSQVAQAFDAQRRNAEQRLTALGVDPSQQRAMQDRSMDIAQAAAQAQAMNDARETAQQFGTSALGDTVNVGRGFQSQATQLGQQALQAGQSGVGTFGGAAGQAGAMTGSPAQWGGLALQGNQGAAGIYSDLGRARTAAHSTPLLDLAAAGLGTAGGFFGGGGRFADGGPTGGQVETGTTQVRQAVPASAFAMDAGNTGVYSSAAPAGGAIPIPVGNVLTAPDGGMAYGPGDGSGIDDNIPAAVSAGEYIIPADVVRKKGTDFFDSMIEKLHTPAAVQQAVQAQARAMPMPQQPMAVAPMGQSPLHPSDSGARGTPGVGTAMPTPAPVGSSALQIPRASSGPYAQPA